MKGYSEREIFTLREIGMCNSISTCIQQMPSALFDEVRCHELVRACHELYPETTEVVDGHYGAVEHSWLLTFGLPKGERGLRNVKALSVLDVYAVGRYPMVQLVDVKSIGLGVLNANYDEVHSHRSFYRGGKERTDIDNAMVIRIVASFKRGVTR